MSIKQTKSGYQVDLHLGRGIPRIQRTFPTFKLADAYYKKKLADYATERNIPELLRSNQTLSEFITYWNETYALPNGLSETHYFIKDLEEKFGHLKLCNISRIQLESWKAEELVKNAPETFNRKLNTVKSIFARAVEWGKLQVSPAQFIKAVAVEPKNFRYLTKEEISRCLVNADLRLKKFLIFALNTGFRKSNLKELSWDQIDMENRIITLTKTKANKILQFPINDTLYVELSSTYYPGIQGKILDVSNLRKEFEGLIKKIGIKKCRIHDLRHTFISHLVMSGVDLFTVSKLAGHSSVKMTERYAHLAPKFKQEAVNRINFGGDNVETFVPVTIVNVENS